MTHGLDHPVKVVACAMNERAPARKRGSRPRTLGSLRLVEMERLLRDRGIENAPVEHFVAAIHHALLEHPEPTSLAAIDAARDHLRVIARHLPHHDRECVVEEAATSLRRWSARALGEALGLTEDERRRLDIRTIRFTGQTLKDQREAKRARDRSGATQRRRDRGSVDRQAYLNTVTSTAELARQHGVSERTIRRWRAAGTMPSDGHVRGPSPILSRRESSPDDATRTLDPADPTNFPAEGVAGLQAAARPSRSAIPSIVEPRIVSSFDEIAMIARRCADRVDQALLPIHLAARRASETR